MERFLCILLLSLLIDIQTIKDDFADGCSPKKFNRVELDPGNHVQNFIPKEH